MKLNDLQVKEFSELFNRIGVMTGMKVPAEILNNPHLMKYLVDEIKKKWGRMDHKETQTAFEMFANNYLPVEINNRQLNYANINKVLHAYNQKEKNHLKPDADESEPTEQEKEQIIRKGLLREFENFNKRSILFNSGNSTYAYLKKMGAFENFSDQQILQIINTAKNEFSSYQKIKQNPYMTAIGNGSTLEQVEGYHFVKAFFLELKNTGVTMESFLETRMELICNK
jgi:hypothetical protein